MRILVFVLLMATMHPAMAHEISDAEFLRLQALIQPKPAEETWLQIPWRVDLWKARQEAAGSGKPILLWEMDGHPLGCT